MKPRMSKQTCISPVNIFILIDSDKITARTLITGKTEPKEQGALEGTYLSVGGQVNLSYSFLRFWNS